MNKRDRLIDSIAAEMKFSQPDKDAFSALVNSWEAANDTMAKIEPDGDSREDAPLLPLLDAQEAAEAKLYETATPRAKQALRLYIVRREETLD